MASWWSYIGFWARWYDYEHWNSLAEDEKIEPRVVDLLGFARGKRHFLAVRKFASLTRNCMWQLAQTTSERRNKEERKKFCPFEPTPKVIFSSLSGDKLPRKRDFPEENRCSLQTRDFCSVTYVGFKIWRPNKRREKGGGQNDPNLWTNNTNLEGKDGRNGSFSYTSL